MRTTLTLDDDVVRTIREEMKSGDGKTFKEAVNELIRVGRYFKEERAAIKRKPFKVKAKNLGVYEHFKHLQPSELLEMLDDEEFLRKARSEK
jgi:hypothetical protein